jgi:hypothetical protein
LKSIFSNSIKLGLVSFIFISSGLALYIHWEGGSFDPIREIQRLRDQNRRDDALDMARFYRENHVADNRELKDLEENLDYTREEKLKSLIWNGAIKGEVYDGYSGLGAISADLCVLGDLRDMVIQSWKYLTKDQSFDTLIMFLSAAGIGLSSTGFLNGCNALTKNTAKYLDKIPSFAKNGVLRKLLTRKVTYEESEKIWHLLKKTDGPSRE